jgi:hypothetical protein
MKNSKRIQSSRRGQAAVEIATFGAIVIFLIGVILRAHLNSFQNMDHETKSLKMALQVSNQNSQGIGHVANSSRNASTVLFIEDRLTPDFNKYATIDRSALVSNATGIMSNRLEYPIDFVTYGNQPFGEVGFNLPIMDVYVNGLHFPLTTAGYVFRVLYQKTDSCPSDFMGLSSVFGPEHARCLRQQHEIDSSGNHLFYGVEVNGTSEYDPNPDTANATFDLLRNDWDASGATCGGESCTNFSSTADNVPGCPSDGDLCNAFTWQWRWVKATPSSFNQSPSRTPKDLQIGLKDSNYPAADTSGSLREQTIYAVSRKPVIDLLAILNRTALTPYEINGNSRLLSLTQDFVNAAPSLGLTLDTNPLCMTRQPGSEDTKQDGCKLAASWPSIITAVVTLDSQMGDIDQTYDSKTSPGATPGLLQDMQIFSNVNSPNTFLQIKEGKLYNPETKAVVRSISSKDHVDLISRSFQLSNNTGHFCQVICPASSQNSWSDSCYVRPTILADQSLKKRLVNLALMGGWRTKVAPLFVMNKILSRCVLIPARRPIFQTRVIIRNHEYFISERISAIFPHASGLPMLPKDCNDEKASRASHN